MAGPKLLSGLMMVLLIDLIGAMEEHSLEGVDVQDLGTSVHEVALLRIGVWVLVVDAKCVGGTMAMAQAPRRTWCTDRSRRRSPHCRSTSDCSLGVCS